MPKTEKQTIAQVHRFNDKVAIYVGKGETTYLTPDEALELSGALHGAATDCKTTLRFSESAFKTFWLER